MAALKASNVGNSKANAQEVVGIKNKSSDATQNSVGGLMSSRDRHSNSSKAQLLVKNRAAFKI